MNDKMVRCDLHLHSCYSDGMLEPGELVGMAREKDLEAVSITDHDTLLGVAEAFAAGEEFGVETLAGIEFSVREQDQELHILGYCFDHENVPLQVQVTMLADARLQRARRMVENLSDRRVHIPFERVLGIAGKGTLGRPHIAKVMLDMGIVSGIQEAFNRYIGFRCPAYVPKTVLGLDCIVRLIRDAGGVAVWAHPGAAVRKRRLLDLVLESGVAGLEVWHPNHSKTVERDILAAVERHGLIATGGSDYHFEEAKRASVGEIGAPYESVRALKRRSAFLR